MSSGLGYNFFITEFYFFKETIIYEKIAEFSAFAAVNLFIHIVMMIGSLVFMRS